MRGRAGWDEVGVGEGATGNGIFQAQQTGREFRLFIILWILVIYYCMDSIHNARMVFHCLTMPLNYAFSLSEIHGAGEVVCVEAWK